MIKRAKVFDEAIYTLGFTSLFFYFLRPLLLGDFWWHLNTGRWIWEHASLLGTDPFTYTAADNTDTRTHVILNGFWLAQVLYYLTYRIAGFAGLVALKAGVFLGLFALLWRHLKRSGIEGITALMVIMPLAFLTERFIEVRPQTFSFILVLLLYTQAEKTMKTLREDRPLGPWGYIQAPLIMLLWANLHRGFIIGYAILGVYLMAETIKLLLKKQPLSGASYKHLVIWALLSMLASFLNPSHVNVLAVNLRELISSGFVKTVEEFAPPWRYAELFGITKTLYGLAVLLIVTLSILVVSVRRLSLSHAMLFVGFTVAALSSFRFVIFFLIMSTAISGGYLASLVTNTKRYQRASATLLVPLFSILLISYGLGESSIKQGLLDRTYLPEAAADFVSSKKPPKPLFNPYELGGYLSWRLYPEYRVFLDARALDQHTHSRYREAKAGRHISVFDDYGINTVLFYNVNPITNEVPGLIFSLLRDGSWELVFHDAKASVFKRKAAGPPLPPIDKEILWRDLKVFFETHSISHPDNPDPLVQLGVIHYAKGETEPALGFFRDALKVDPENQQAEAWIKLMEERETGDPTSRNAP